LSETRPPNVYYPGDEIRIRVSYKHAGPHHSVEVVYVHTEHESHTLTLSGNPELPEEGEGDERHSTVVVSEVVDVKHIPGRYTVARALFYSYSGQVFGLEAPGAGPTLNPLIAPLGVQLVSQTLGGNWPEIEIRPESPYAEITSVELDPEF
jgi:hypothetical protein